MKAVEEKAKFKNGSFISSKGKIQDDLKQIAIDRLNYVDENAYNNLDRESKKKIDDYTREQAIAMSFFRKTRDEDN